MRFERLPSLRLAEIETDTFGGSADRDIIADEIERGISELWRIDDGKAYMVTRMETDELVIVAFQGKGLANVAPILVETAKRHGLDSIRFHTKRPALARLLKHWQPEHVEHVYRVHING